MKFVEGMSLTGADAVTCVSTLAIGALGLLVVSYLWKSKRIHKRIQERQNQCKESIAELEEIVRNNEVCFSCECANKIKTVVYRTIE